MFPLPIRLNNPGGIKKTDRVWRGATRLQDNDKYVRFFNPIFGLRALMEGAINPNNPPGLDALIDTTIERVMYENGLPPAHMPKNWYALELFFEAALQTLSGET